jgi:hypothetical protein
MTAIVSDTKNTVLQDAQRSILQAFPIMQLFETLLSTSKMTVMAPQNTGLSFR